MVKDTNKRVMITLPKTTIERLLRICDMYGISLSTYIKMVVNKEVLERK